MFKLIIRERARKNINEAVSFYENRKPGLGEEFSKQVYSYLQEIKNYPGHYQIKRKNLREAVIRKFPYVIIFEVAKREIIVYSVFHSSQNPAKKP